MSRKGRQKLGALGHYYGTSYHFPVVGSREVDGCALALTNERPTIGGEV